MSISVSPRSSLAPVLPSEMMALASPNRGVPPGIAAQAETVVETKVPPDQNHELDTLPDLTVLKPIHIVLIKALSTGPDPRYAEITQAVPVTASQLPSVETVTRGLALAQQYGYTIKLHIVDPVAAYRLLPDDAKTIATYPPDVATVHPYTPEEFVDEVEIPPEELVVYMDYRNLGIHPDVFLNSFEVMHHVLSFELNQRYYVIGTKQSEPPSIENVVIEILYRINHAPLPDPGTFYYLPPDYYNLVGGEKVPAYVADYDLEGIKYHLSALAEITANYISAGFLDGTVGVNAINKSWYMNVDTLILGAFFDRYPPQLPSKDADVQSALLTNASFRRDVTVSLIGILSNFVVNNQILTPEDIAKLGGYRQPLLYQQIQQRLATLTVPVAKSVVQA